MSTRTLFLENCSRFGSTSDLSSCSLFLMKSVSGRWGLKTAAWARLIHISTSDLVYILLPKGCTMRLPPLSNWRLIEHDQTPVVLLIIHSMGHLWMIFDYRMLVSQWAVNYLPGAGSRISRNADLRRRLSGALECAFMLERNTYTAHCFN